MIFIARVKGDPVVISCSEYGCGASWSMPDEDVPAALERGDVVIRMKPQAGYSTSETVGVCAICQAKYKQTARARRQGKRNVDAEHAELMQLVARTREAHPDWSLKRCVHESVNFVNSAAEEKNPGFRAYLLEREDS